MDRSPDAVLEHPGRSAATPDYARFSRLAGPLQAAPAGPYRVQYRNLVRKRGGLASSVLIVVADVVFAVVFFTWLLSPEHLPQGERPGWEQVATWSAAASILLIELFKITNVLTLCLSSLVARDPVPVAPEPGTRVAFLTTIVPSSEPWEIVARTLAAARRVRHDGVFDVWLLDEGDDARVRRGCEALGVHHFSRRGVEEWNQASGPMKARSKHGNYNAWLAAHGHAYDFFVSVDPDHVPRENFAERLLGYFRDPDVAFVIGPQVYGNVDSWLTRAAESQQYLFHGLVQRAANAYRCGMMVGTNNAVRISALDAIGGIQDSVTEDLCTSLAFHTSTNRATGRRWTSVYTPDVLAVGEGPSTWADFFSQQYRWSRGAHEVIVRNSWYRIPRLRPGQALHYCMLLAFYPTTALAWLLGAASAMLYLLFGVSSLTMEYGAWLVLYTNTATLQLALFFWNRRYNISPHEPEGSSGFSGMVISTLSAPVYVSAMLGTLTLRRPNFVVTPKGDSATKDHLGTFRVSLRWAVVFAAGLVASIVLGHVHPAMSSWCVLTLTISALPLLIWWGSTWSARRHAPAPAAAAAVDPAPGAPAPPAPAPVPPAPATRAATPARLVARPLTARPVQPSPEPAPSSRRAPHPQPEPSAEPERALA